MSAGSKTYNLAMDNIRFLTLSWMGSKRPLSWRYQVAYEHFAQLLSVVWRGSLQKVDRL